MIRPQEWELIRASRVEAVFDRLRELPSEYQDWVIRQATGRGIARLHRDTRLGPGEVTTYDALVAVCERELARKAAQPQGDAR